MSRVQETLRIEGLNLAYGERVIVADADLSVGRGEVIGITGPNGSGKSTLLNAIGGWHRRECGGIWLEGQKVSDWSPSRIARCGVRRSFQGGLVLETGDLALQMALSRLGPSVLSLPLLLGRRRLARATDEAARATDALSLTGGREALIPMAQSLPTLSGGLRRFADTMSAIYGATKLCLLDEPFSGLDDDRQNLVQRAIESAAAGGAALIVIDHNLPRLTATAHLIHRMERTAGGPFSLARS